MRSRNPPKRFSNLFTVVLSCYTSKTLMSEGQFVTDKLFRCYFDLSLERKIGLSVLASEKRMESCQYINRCSVFRCEDHNSCRTEKWEDIPNG